MAKSRFNFDLPEDDAPDSRPVGQAAHGSTATRTASGSSAWVMDTSAPQRPSRGRAGAQRGPDGRMLKDGYGGFDTVSGKWCPAAKNRAMLHHPDSERPVPYNRPSYSGMPSIAESQHRRMCPGGNMCPAPAFHFGLQDGGL